MANLFSTKERRCMDHLSRNSQKRLLIDPSLLRLLYHACKVRRPANYPSRRAPSTCSIPTWGCGPYACPFRKPEASLTIPYRTKQRWHMADSSLTQGGHMAIPSYGHQEGHLTNPSHTNPRRHLP